MSKLISEEEKYIGPRFKVTQKIYLREDGKRIIRDIVEPGEAAVILPITDNNEVVFITQYRESVNKVSLELPAGMVDSGEEPIETAKRELEEETGLIANNIEPLISLYPSTGYTSEKVHIFVAKDFQNGKQRLDSTEEILSVKKIKIEECVDKIKKGELENASQIIGILLYYTKYMK